MITAQFVLGLVCISTFGIFLVALPINLISYILTLRTLKNNASDDWEKLGRPTVFFGASIRGGFEVFKYFNALLKADGQQPFTKNFWWYKCSLITALSCFVAMLVSTATYGTLYL